MAKRVAKFEKITYGQFEKIGLIHLMYQNLIQQLREKLKAFMKRLIFQQEQQNLVQDMISQVL